MTQNHMGNAQVPYEGDGRGGPIATALIGKDERIRPGILHMAGERGGSQYENALIERPHLKRKNIACEID